MTLFVCSLGLRIVIKFHRQQISAGDLLRGFDPRINNFDGTKY